ncbi:MAG TPA: DUF998 domain-containing protein [Solirubrobacterales bacterium]|nr:DUF998 domain-containing protein [Solirubrobacterales bacterium]
MGRPRTIALAGVAAALLCNYWVLEGLLADRYDLDSSWISDLATRSESSGWRFVALGVLSGLAIAGFALLLMGPLGGRSRTLRLGVNALLATGAMVVIASAAPLDCAEGLEPTCSLAYDPLDVIHVAATAGEIIATVLAFLLIGLGLLPRVRSNPRISRVRTDSRIPAGEVTLGLGALWLLLTALTGVTYLGDAIDGIKGLLQRGDQVLFGAWLILLGAWTGKAAPPSGGIARVKVRR